jgi:hypothetical protein
MAFGRECSRLRWVLGGGCGLAEATPTATKQGSTRSNRLSPILSQIPPPIHNIKGSVSPTRRRKDFYKCNRARRCQVKKPFFKAHELIHRGRATFFLVSCFYIEHLSRMNYSMCCQDFSNQGPRCKLLLLKSCSRVLRCSKS